jgi:hypothetical protein
VVAPNWHQRTNLWREGTNHLRRSELLIGIGPSMYGRRQRLLPLLSYGPDLCQRALARSGWGLFIHFWDENEKQMKTVRELSLAAPCNVLGIFVKETAHRITYRLRDGREAFARKSCRLHVEPCPSCSGLDLPNAKRPQKVPGENGGGVEQTSGFRVRGPMPDGVPLSPQAPHPSGE